MVRTLSSVIIGLGERIATEENIENLNSVGEAISRQGRNLLLLINQILDVSKLKSNVPQSEYQHGDIIGYIHMIFDGAKVLADRKNIQYQFHAQEKTVEMDFIPDYITKIVGNLISNAIKFTPFNGQVSISTKTKNNRFVLTVQDNGCGISTKDLPYIFDAFYQCDTSLRTIGSGIGLSLVKQLVEAMNGSITVESEENKGSTFTVTLLTTNSTSHPDKPVIPLREAPAVNDIFIIDGDGDGEESEYMDDNDDMLTRILIVEDNYDVSSFIGSVIHDANISYARNGSEGFEKALQIVPDIIITDVMMPIMDGIELTKLLKEDKRFWQLPVILLTAKNKEEDKTEAYTIGADAYITKPFKFEELEVRINALLANRKKLIEKIESVVSLQTKEEADAQPKVHLSDPDQEFVTRATEMVMKHLGDADYDRESFAKDMAMGESTLYNKVKATTGQTVIAFITTIRMKEARRIMQSNPNILISDVATQVGFNTPKYFSKCFKKEFGIFPKEYAEELKKG